MCVLGSLSHQNGFEDELYARPIIVIKSNAFLGDGRFGLDTGLSVWHAC